MRFRRLPLGLPRMDLNEAEIEDNDPDSHNIKPNVKRLRYFSNYLYVLWHLYGS